MVQHLRTIGLLWAIAGVAFVLWGIVGFLYDSHWSWVFPASFGVVAVFCGWVLGVSGIPSKFWSSLVAGPVLLYATVFVLFGGVEDAPEQALVVAVTVAIAIYNLVVVFRARRNAP